VLAPVVLTVTGAVARVLERRSEDEQQQAGSASARAADLVHGLRVIKGLHAEEAASRRYRAVSRSSVAAAVRAGRSYAATEGVVTVGSGLFIAGIAYAAATAAAADRISVGDLVAVIGVAQFLLTPLQTLAWASAEIARGRASAGRVAALLPAADAPDAPDAASVPPGRAEPDTPGTRHTPGTGCVRLVGLRHGPLADVDLEVPAGTSMGVVTDPVTAAALLDCLALECEPEQGKLELDGVPHRNLAPSTWRARILVAPHDADLFADPLHAVVLPGAGPDDPRLSAALEACAADHVAACLPGGVRAELAHGAPTLSGGQRQRVALARALAADPDVLVLHDPTTAVDAVTETQIAAGLARLRAGRTTVLVTTSPALLATTDTVVHLHGGRVQAVGRHEDLLGDCRYRTAVLA
jgi:putative ABC transport system ATP-binding protein